MRLKINLVADSIVLPLNYQSLIQGFIYNIFEKEDYGNFLHNQGYRFDKRVFKMFVFSNLFGKYEIKDHNIIFDHSVTFYISSQIDSFLKCVYSFLLENNQVLLGNQILRVNGLELLEMTASYQGDTYQIRTLSPVVAYRMNEGNKVIYYKPSDPEFTEICLQNLIEKNKAIGEIIPEILFSVENVDTERKRIVRFKNTFYIGYLSAMSIHTNYDTLKLIYNTGLSSKGPAGFGMIDIVR